MYDYLCLVCVCVCVYIMVMRLLTPIYSRYDDMRYQIISDEPTVTPLGTETAHSLQHKRRMYLVTHFN